MGTLIPAPRLVFDAVPFGRRLEKSGAIYYITYHSNPYVAKPHVLRIVNGSKLAYGYDFSDVDWRSANDDNEWEEVQYLDCHDGILLFVWIRYIKTIVGGYSVFAQTFEPLVIARDGYPFFVHRPAAGTVKESNHKIGGCIISDNILVICHMEYWNEWVGGAQLTFYDVSFRTVHRNGDVIFSDNLTMQFRESYMGSLDWGFSGDNTPSDIRDQVKTQGYGDITFAWRDSGGGWRVVIYRVTGDGAASRVVDRVVSTTLNTTANRHRDGILIGYRNSNNYTMFEYISATANYYGVIPGYYYANPKVTQRYAVHLLFSDKVVNLNDFGYIGISMQDDFFDASFQRYLLCRVHWYRNSIHGVSLWAVTPTGSIELRTLSNVVITNYLAKEYSTSAGSFAVSLWPDPTSIHYHYVGSAIITWNAQIVAEISLPPSDQWEIFTADTINDDGIIVMLINEQNYSNCKILRIGINGILWSIDLIEDVHSLYFKWPKSVGKTFAHRYGLLNTSAHHYYIRLSDGQLIETSSTLYPFFPYQYGSESSVKEPNAFAPDTANNRVCILDADGNVISSLPMGS